jgi:low temperature requirement protein LtrA
VTEQANSATAAESVRPLELFFDLVFVFTITQVASVLTATPTPLGLARVTALLAVIFWMYGGYAWLTNALDLDRVGPRLLLLLGTAGFFVMSLSVPRAAERGPWGLVFGLSYLLVVAVHTVGFLGTSGHRGILRIGPYNLASAHVVVAAGAVPPQPRLWLWVLACAMEWVTPYLSGVGGFTVGVGHFVERHGLAVIIVLGESIAEVGAAESRQQGVLTVVVGALLALALSAAMWWLYFGREEHEGAELLERAPAERRPRLALHSFGYAYLVLIWGIAVAAVGMQKAIDSFTGPLRGLPAGLLPLGVGLYLLGLAIFHRSLSGRWPVARVVSAAALPAVALPASLLAGGAAGLVAALLILLALVVAEHGRR